MKSARYWGRAVPTHTHRTNGRASNKKHSTTLMRQTEKSKNQLSCKNQTFCVGNPTFTHYFWDFGPTWDAWRQKPNIYELCLGFVWPAWDVWCQKPNIYESFLGFWTHLGCLVSETQHLRIIFEVLDLHLGCLVLETHFPRKCFKNNDFYTVWEPVWYTKADPPDPANPANPAEMVHSWQFAP